jgi:Pyruvate/2-oxoacid:ferredoxin oxidoreductase delta subunit
MLMTMFCILYSPDLQNINSDTKEQYTTSYNTCRGQVRPERLV